MYFTRLPILTFCVHVSESLQAFAGNVHMYVAKEEIKMTESKQKKEIQTNSYWTLKNDVQSRKERNRS